MSRERYRVYLSTSHPETEYPGQDERCRQDHLHQADRAVGQWNGDLVIEQEVSSPINK